MASGSTLVLINPGAALATGLITGSISTLGFMYLSPFLEARMGIKDTCGVHNLHGVPGVVAGVVAAINLGIHGLG